MMLKLNNSASANQHSESTKYCQWPTVINTKKQKSPAHSIPNLCQTQHQCITATPKPLLNNHRYRSVKHGLHHALQKRQSRWCKANLCNPHTNTNQNKKQPLVAQLNWIEISDTTLTFQHLKHLTKMKDRNGITNETKTQCPPGNTIDIHSRPSMRIGHIHTSKPSQLF